MNEKKSRGLFTPSEYEIRLYICMSFHLRYNAPEPNSSDWHEAAAKLSVEAGSTLKTVRQLFKKCVGAGSLSQDIAWRKGSGPKRKLPANNRGLRAAAIALNAGISCNHTIDICNDINAVNATDEAPPVTIGRTLLVESLKEYSDHEQCRVLRRVSRELASSGTRNLKQ
jgi:hypothetical protein